MYELNTLLGNKSGFKLMITIYISRTWWGKAINLKAEDKE